MGLVSAGLESFLTRHKRVGLDTSIFIYQIEEHPRYQPLVLPLFEWLAAGRLQGVTSTITMLEVLVQPYRMEDLARVAKFYALLSQYPNLHWLAPTLAVADRAARLRGRSQLRTPDAVQAATALDAGATGFVCNDAAFARVDGLDVLLLDTLVR